MNISIPLPNKSKKGEKIIMMSKQQEVTSICLKVIIQNFLCYEVTLLTFPSKKGL